MIYSEYKALAIFLYVLSFIYVFCTTIFAVMKNFNAIIAFSLGFSFMTHYIPVFLVKFHKISADSIIAPLLALNLPLLATALYGAFIFMIIANNNILYFLSVIILFLAITCCIVHNFILYSVEINYISLFLISINVLSYGILGISFSSSIDNGNFGSTLFEILLYLSGVASLVSIFTNYCLLAIRESTVLRTSPLLQI